MRPRVLRGYVLAVCVRKRSVARRHMTFSFCVESANIFVHTYRPADMPPTNISDFQWAKPPNNLPIKSCSDLSAGRRL